MSRVIALQFDNDKARENALAFIAKIAEYKVDCKLIVFRKNGLAPLGAKDLTEAEFEFPEGVDNDSKMKNFILKKMQSDGFNGFLHIVSQAIVLHKDPNEYLAKLEHTMDVLDYSIYFSTVTDPCNYVFKKFCPRLSIEIDDEHVQQKLALPSKLSFTSHSNLGWIVYDFSKMPDGPMLFNEQFSIAMFEIIEYLARRRATKKEGQLYYMNQYLSIVDEVGVYSLVELWTEQIDSAKMQEEDALFKSMDVDYAPDNNLDIILDAFYAKLKEKMV